MKLDELTKMTEITEIDEEDEYQEKIDFNHPEDVIVFIEESEGNWGYGEWKNHSIAYCDVIQKDDVIMGAASYDACYGGFLDFTMQDLIDDPKPGWFVVENVTGVYHKGDGYMTDDDMDFYCKKVRPATKEEIEKYEKAIVYQEGCTE